MAGDCDIYDDSNYNGDIGNTDSKSKILLISDYGNNDKDIDDDETLLSFGNHPRQDHACTLDADILQFRKLRANIAI